MRKKTHEQFIQEVYDLYKDEYTVSGKYINTDTKILMKHNKCDNTWMSTPYDFLGKKSHCPECAKLNLSKLKTKSSVQYKKEVFDLVGDEYTVLGEYTANNKSILMKHNKCGREYTVRPINFLRKEGNRCFDCTLIKSNKQYKKEVFDLVGDEYTVLGEYKTTKIKILMRHDICGYEYRVRPMEFLSGNRCPKCAKTSKPSRKELALLSFIQSIYKGKIIHGDKSILEGKEIDILLPNKLLGFEFNGTYWHSRKFKPEGYHKDKTKRAAIKGAKLIHIAEKQWDKMNISIKSMVKNQIQMKENSINEY